MPIKSVFFDLDGTLWDYRACSEYVMDTAAARLREVRGIDAPDIDRRSMLNVALLDAVIEGGMKNLAQPFYTRRFEKYFERRGFSESGLAREMSTYCHSTRRFSVRTFLKDDAHETLARLKNRDVSTGVLTNGTPAVKRNVIEALGLADMLDHIVLGEAEGLVKPDMRLFSHCIELSGRSPGETLFVGDCFFTDLLGAKRAKAQVMLLCERRLKMPARFPPPDFVMKNLSDVLKII